ncbi:TPA: AAA family ATPase [Citrobacter freundii]|uniref:AAA family ATPase n=1 Tax=Citrobacter freundii TaxID=546 RepID=UPI0020238CF9|nr:AAA family ATPase [Citrobacter freundii]MCY3448708.1 AAA family ATPase [Citrobacter freundii]HCD1231306.1 AAA family ATPase [Citrobacter freundii]HEE9968020.1 AAA family ATPase [Citrobacter freundii]HEE9983231.1 AAA family ATPase [Citrobacter freundii]
MSIQSVVDWANKLKKNLWWLHAVRLAADKGELKRDDFELLFTVAKIEHGLEAPTESYASYIAPLNLTGFGEEKNAVNLKSISKVRHVSALVSDTLLEFATDGLTAVYGDNGSGKSSYAKIIKNSCLTRGDTPKILPNIYEEKGGEPAADIAIVIGQEQHDIAWRLSTPAQEDLKSIRIFDNTSATHYICGEDTIEYKPAGMKLLSQLMLACEFVRTSSDNEKKPYTVVNVLPTFRPGSNVFSFVSKLSDKTQIEDIEALCISKEQEDSIPAHYTELAKLKTSTPEQIRKAYNDRCKGLQPLLDHLLKLKSKLDQECVNTIKNAFDDYETKQRAAELARAQALDGHELSGICSREWTEMWNHVKSFVQTYNAELDFPPSEGEPCPTCLQTISGESAKKLKSFNDYLQNKTQVEATKAKGVFDTLISNLKLLKFDLKPYEFSLGMIREHNSEYAQNIIALNSSLETLYGNLIKAEPEFTPIKVEFKAVDWISGQIGSWKKKEAEVATNEGLIKQIADLTAQTQELEDRKLFTSAKQNILAEIKRHKILALYRNLANSCQSASITTLTNSIAKSGAIGQLQEAFREELKKFGFENLEVGTETRGLRGKQMLKLCLTGKENGIMEVASEGEQKCVALASFLAELTVDDRKSAIIFDDPINSLDHKWRRKFADRVVKESLARQVIVFTHDISFLKMLEEASSVAKSKLALISIAKYGDKAGLTFPEPPWDAKNTLLRISFLKNLLPDLKKLEISGDARYEFHAKHIYNLMRETWERLVEEWLLRKVVERFSRGVKTQSLKEIADDVTIEDNNIINAAMAKCSTYMYGHDNATELAVDCPRYSEVEQDVASLDTYFKILKKRRS